MHLTGSHDYFCTMNRYLVILWLTYFSLIFNACGIVDVDNTAPWMEWQNNGSPLRADSICGGHSQQVILLSGRDTLLINLLLTDNESLGQLKIDIHDNFDCHGHSNKTADWYVQEIMDLDGTSLTVNLKYPVPLQPTAGYYHLTVRLIDDNGNEGIPLYIDLVVRNEADTIAPVLKVLLPELKEVNVVKGEEIPLRYSLTDNKTLGQPNSRLVLLYRDLSSGNVFTINKIDLSEPDTTASLDFVFKVPATWKTGNTYRLEAYGFDGVNNQSKRAGRVLAVAK